MVSNSVTWVKTEKLIETRSCFCVGIHRHTLLGIDIDLHMHRCMHIALCGSGSLVLKPKSYRKTHKSLLVGRKRRGGGQEG